MIIRIIEITTEQVAVARFAVRRGVATFLGGQREVVPTGSDLAAALSKLAEPPTEDERLVLLLPPSQVVLRQVALPLADRRQLRDVLPLELKGELAQETAEMIFDALPGIGTSWAFWLPQVRLQPLLATCRASGSDPEIATYAPACWGELVPLADQERTIALCDGTGLAVYADGVPRFFRSFSGPLADELSRTLVALAVGQELVVDRCYLFGPAAGALQTERANFPAETALLPTDGFLTATFGSDHLAARDLASMAAVAMVVAVGAPLNFRQGPLAYSAGNERTRKALCWTALLAACLVLALGAELVVRWQLLRRDVASLNTSIAAQYREVFPKRKAVDEVAEVKAEIRRLAGGGRDASPLATLKVLADNMGEGITAITEVETDATTLRLRGEARSLAAVNELKGRLASQFTAVELSESRSKPSGEVSFVFRAGALRGEVP